MNKSTTSDKFNINMKLKNSFKTKLSALTDNIPRDEKNIKMTRPKESLNLLIGTQMNFIKEKQNNNNISTKRIANVTNSVSFPKVHSNKKNSFNEHSFKNDSSINFYKIKSDITTNRASFSKSKNKKLTHPRSTSEQRYKSFQNIFRKREIHSKFKFT